MPVPRHGNAGAVKDRIVVVTVRAIDQEGISLAAAYDAARFSDSLPNALCHALKHLVAVAFSVTVVERAEMVDVQQDRVCGGVLMIDVKLSGVAVEKLLVVKSREMIALRPAQNIPILRQLDRAQDTGQDDLLLRIGLGNKIDCAKRQALHLGLTVGGHDDYGNTGIHRVFPDPAQHLQSMDIRQIQIQQNQAERFVLHADDFQRFCPGKRLDDFIGVADKRF